MNCTIINLAISRGDAISQVFTFLTYYGFHSCKITWLSLSGTVTDVLCMYHLKRVQKGTKT